MKSTLPKPHWQATSGLTLAAMVLSLFTPLMSEPAHPTWWGDRGVSNTNNAENLAVANLGQLKHVANQAHAELETIIPDGSAAPFNICLLYTSPSPRDLSTSRMPSSA